MPTHFDEYEKQARQLAQIAKTLSKRSAKYAALKRAAWALAFVTMQHHSEFQQFLSDQQSRELSAGEQKLQSQRSDPKNFKSDTRVGPQTGAVFSKVSSPKGLKMSHFEIGGDKRIYQHLSESPSLS